MLSKNYILTFKARGVSVFVTDVHRDVYKHLHVIFLIRKGNFYQLFPKKYYALALEEGVKFYKNTSSLNQYVKNLKALIIDIKSFHSRLLSSKNLSKNEFEVFFNLITKLCKDYTKMNTEYTDKAYSYKNNKTIQNNLSKIISFKDMVRSFMNTVLFEPHGYTHTLFKKISKQFNIDEKKLHYLTRAEILSLFKGNTAQIKNFKGRANAVVIQWNSAEPIQGKEATQLINDFLNKTKKEDILEGMSANPGFVKGVVKIIKTDYSHPNKLAKEISKMKPNSILIAETTAPELTLACKKAAAIVTDLGGLMSHAAIISRELNIPCIVGTESATTTFKDGDMVEVDANKGIVKKL